MKKLASLLLAMLMVAGIASARDRISRDMSTLPAAAQQIIKTHFGKTGVNHIKIDSKTFGGEEYDVILNNGTEIEFDQSGNIKEIDCGSRAIPDQLILKPIRDFVAKNFKGQKIVAMEVKRNRYEIELLSGQELEFDRAGKFLKVDN
ncbi:MAG: PepSY-like domain-containing protein [Muribaculaceae bacterium]|nr:PepSY-like domain-containing protein [Muribaculaceae bacterium]